MFTESGKRGLLEGHIADELFSSPYTVSLDAAIRTFPPNSALAELLDNKQPPASSATVPSSRRIPPPPRDPALQFVITTRSREIFAAKTAKAATKTARCKSGKKKGKKGRR